MYVAHDFSYEQSKFYQETLKAAGPLRAASVLIHMIHSANHTLSPSSHQLFKLEGCTAHACLLWGLLCLLFAKLGCSPSSIGSAV